MNMILPLSSASVLFRPFFPEAYSISGIVVHRRRYLLSPQRIVRERDESRARSSRQRTEGRT